MPLEPCEKRAARVSSTALVRYRGNDHAVPTSHGFQEVIVKGLVDQVVILCGGEEIARHQRSYGSGTFVFDPPHYLASRSRSGAPAARRACLSPSPPRPPWYINSWRRATRDGF